MQNSPRDLMRRKLLALMRAHAMEARAIMRDFVTNAYKWTDFYTTSNRAATYLQMACDYRNMARRLT